MNASLRSQESVCSSSGSPNDADDNENAGANSITQPFYTQISEAPAVSQTSQHLASIRAPVPQDSKGNPGKSMQGTPSPLWPNNGAREASSGPAGEPMNRVECPSHRVTATTQTHDDVHESARTNRTPSLPTQVACHHQRLTPLHDDHWPGGRRLLTNGRYLPRHIARVPKDQQRILETPSAWQPSKVDRKIRGSIPNVILNYFTELADEAPDIPACRASLEPELSPVRSIPAETMQANHGRHRDLSEAVIESPESIAASSWIPTPQSPSLPEPAFPDNSSPLRMPHRQLTPSLSGNSSVMASADHASKEGQNVQNGLSMPPLKTKTVSVIRQEPEAAEVASQAALTQEPTRTAPHSVATGEGVEKFPRIPSPDHPMSSSQERGQCGDAELPKEPSKKTSPREAQPGPISNLNASQTQEIVSHEIAKGNTLIQVYRSPFVHPYSARQTAPRDCDQRTAFPFPKWDGVVFKDPEPISESFVPGTFMNPQGKHEKQSRISSRESSQGESDSGEDELMEEEVGSGIIEIRKAAKAVNSASPGPPSSMSEAHSKSPDRFSQLRPLKRQYCSHEHTLPKIHPTPETEVGQPCPSSTSAKRPRIVSALASLDALRDLRAGESPSEIARESRREFFRNQQRSTSNASPLLTSNLKLKGSHGEKSLKRQHSTDCGISRCTRSRQITPRTSLPFHTGSNPGVWVDAFSRASVQQQKIYDTYKATYPEYHGDSVQFQKACKHLSVLRREGKAPHPSLWDDFIFRRHHDYREYLLEVTAACEDAIPYLQYYMEHVEKPSRMELVIRPCHILSLESDSDIGSSVTNQPLKAPTHSPKCTEDHEVSATTTSSASNILLTQGTSLQGVDANRQQSTAPRYEPSSSEQDEVEQSQDSSMKQWVATQSVEKMLGAASPELGCTDIPAADEDDTPKQGLDWPAGTLAFSSPDRLPSQSEQQSKEPVWWDDPHAPFKSFARSYVALASEKKHLRSPIRVDDKGCLRPQLQNVINIFTRYKEWEK